MQKFVSGTDAPNSAVLLTEGKSTVGLGLGEGHTIYVETTPIQQEVVAAAEFLKEKGDTGEYFTQTQIVAAAKKLGFTFEL